MTFMVLKVLQGKVVYEHKPYYCCDKINSE